MRAVVEGAANNLECTRLRACRGCVLRVLPPGNTTGALYSLHSDHLGSTSVTTSDTGTVLARQWYHPYGSVRASTGALPTDITFTGQRSDATGLYFYNARYYSAVLGRFISADTIVPEPGNPQALNRYAYVFNNPLKYTDPSGHDPCTGIPGTYMPDCGVDGWGMHQVNARIYYLNSIGLGPNGKISPAPYQRDEQAYTLYRLELIVGSENVKHIPIYTTSTANSVFGRLVNYWEMFGEAFERRTWSGIVADTIAQDLADNPLLPGQRLIIVGASGGGTVAVESLDLLQNKGIYVDQLILRGSFVQETTLVNVGRVDYITSNFYGGVIPSDHYYSYDSNPYDGIQVREHRVDFYGHVPPDDRSRVLVVDLIVSLISR